MIREAPPLALYVHFPWCVRKCPYCDFNSHKAPAAIPEAQYIDYLVQDLEYELTHVPGRPLNSIFLGGGTPSLFSPESVSSFLRAVRERMPVSPSLEITLEANPGTIERGRFEGYREAGITRVSLGAQSFNKEQLTVLGRIHSAEDIGFAVAELKAAGIANFNIDLMYGLPNQSVQQAVDDVQIALAFRPAHLSHYQLTLEPGTAFYHHPPPLPDDDRLWDMQLACQAEIASAGYDQYEVSAYSLRGKQCVHNLNYWQFGDYLGIGAGAHGKRTDVDRQLVTRTTRSKQPREYLSLGDAVDRVHTTIVGSAELPFEFLLNALRLKSGFSTDLFECRTGLPMQTISHGLSIAMAKTLLENSAPHRWVPTELGYRFLNDLQAEFLPSRAPH